jgi:hypothetical protein
VRIRVASDDTVTTEHDHDVDGISYTVTIRWAALDGSLQPAAVTVGTGADDRPIRAGVIRRVPLGRLIRDAREESRSAVDRWDGISLADGRIREVLAAVTALRS